MSVQVCVLRFTSSAIAWAGALCKQASLAGISDVRDESDRDGMRVVIEVKRGFNAELVLNNLYKHTSLQKQFNCNLVALVGGTPKTLSLKEILVHFLDFRCELDMLQTKRNTFTVKSPMLQITNLESAGLPCIYSFIVFESTQFSK